MDKPTFKCDVELDLNFCDEINLSNINKSRSSLKSKPILDISESLSSNKLNNYRIDRSKSVSFPPINETELYDNSMAIDHGNDKQSIDQSNSFDMINSSNLNIHFEDKGSTEYSPLYKDSSLRLDEVCFLLLAFKDRFTLTNACFEALLVLIHFLLPFGNKIPTNITKLNRIITTNNEKINKKLYCRQCQSLIKEVVCQNIKCSEFSKIPNDYDIFHFVSVKKQLKLNVEHFYKQILNYKMDIKGYYDITNSEHKKNSNCIDLMLYSDGVKLRKNNKKFWPVFLSLCDLPLILRDSKSNKIIAGLFTNNMYKSVGNHI